MNKTVHSSIAQAGQDRTVRCTPTLQYTMRRIVVYSSAVQHSTLYQSSHLSITTGILCHEHLGMMPPFHNNADRNKMDLWMTTVDCTKSMWNAERSILVLPGKLYYTVPSIYFTTWGCRLLSEKCRPVVGDCLIIPCDTYYTALSVLYIRSDNTTVGGQTSPGIMTC